jgi:hypothetical protein
MDGIEKLTQFNGGLDLTCGKGWEERETHYPYLADRNGRCAGLTTSQPEGELPMAPQCRVVSHCPGGSGGCSPVILFAIVVGYLIFRSII